MASTVTSEAPVSLRSKHHLLSLPQEIQDEIFTLAYPRYQPSFDCDSDPGLRVVDKKAWDREQLDNLPSEQLDQLHPPCNYPAVVPYPGPKVNDFLVSKRFFVAAAQAYISNQTITRGVYSDDTLKKHSGIITAFASHVEVSTDRDPLDVKAKDLPAMKTLELYVGCGVFAPLIPKLHAGHTFTTEDMAETEDWDDIVELVKRVTDLSITQDPWCTCCVGAPLYPYVVKYPWDQKLILYEESLRPFVGLARRSEVPQPAAGQASVNQAPLYPGSAVLWRREGSVHEHETANTAGSESTIDITNLSYGARKDILKRLIESDAGLAARILKDHVEQRSHAEEDEDEEVVFAGRGYAGLHWLGKVLEDLDLEHQ